MGHYPHKGAFMSRRTFESQKQLTVSKTYRAWEEYSEGDVVVGKIIGTHTDKYGKVCRIINVEEASFKKVDGATFQGKNLVLNSGGMLDKALDGIKEGEFIQIEYKGQSVISKGPFSGKKAHVVDVILLKETTDASAAADSSGAPAADASSGL